MEKIYISQEFSLVIIVLVGLFFVTLGYYNSRKIPNNKNYSAEENNIYVVVQKHKKRG